MAVPRVVRVGGFAVFEYQRPHVCFGSGRTPPLASSCWLARPDPVATSDEHCGKNWAVNPGRVAVVD